MDKIIICQKFIENVVENLGTLTPMFSTFLIVIESFFPILPLFLFISANLLVLGNVLGFIISYLSCVMGSYSFFIVIRKFNKNKFNKIKTSVDKLDFIKTTLIISLPYTPSSLINFSLGVGSISKKDYLISLFIGKFFYVLFWGFVGKNLIESLTDVKTLFILLIMMSLSFIMSKMVEVIYKKKEIKNGIFI